MSPFTVIPAKEEQAAFQQLTATYGGVFYESAFLPDDDQLLQYVIVAADGQCIGGFQVYRLKLKGISTLSVAPWHPHCALFVVPRDGGVVARQTYRKQIAAALADFLAERSEPLVSVPLPPEWSDVQPFIWKGFHCTVKYTYRLAQGATEASALFSAKTRNSIRKARKDGVEVLETRHASEVYKGLSASAVEKGFDINQARLERLLSGFGKGACFALAAKAAGRVIASAVIVHDTQTAYYLLGGVDRQHAGQGALAILVDHAIRKTNDAGCEIFDFEGSMIPEVEQFVRGFGGVIQPYYVVAKSPDWMVPLLRLRGKSEF